MYRAALPVKVIVEVVVVTILGVGVVVAGVIMLEVNEVELVS